MRKKRNSKREERGLRVIDVMKDIDVLVSEDWQNSNGDIVTYTAKLDEDGFIAEDVENLRMIHLRKEGTILLSVVITEKQFGLLNEALFPFRMRQVEASQATVEKILSRQKRSSR